MTAGLTGALGVAGLYFAHSLRRRTNQEISLNVAAKRFDAYVALWAETKAAAGMRTLTGQGPLSPGERGQLAERLTEWYYDKGNGMFALRGNPEDLSGGKERPDTPARAANA